MRNCLLLHAYAEKFDDAIHAGGNVGMGRVTIGDVAKAAGVNHSTASRALSGQRYVKATTRERVLEAAKRLGYRPDPALAALARERWRQQPASAGSVLALVNWTELRRLEHPHAKGFAREAQRLGYDVQVFSRCEWEPEPDADRLARVLRARGIRGVAVWIQQARAEWPQADWTDFAVVQLGLWPGGESPADVVANDTFANHLMAMQRALRSAYQRPGLVLLEPRHMAEELRRIGGAEAAWRAQERKDPMPVAWLRSGDQRSASILAEWLDSEQVDFVLGQTAVVGEWLRAIRGSAGTGPGFFDLSYLENQEQVGATAARVLAGKLQQGDYGLPDVTIRTLVPG